MQANKDLIKEEFGRYVDHVGGIKNAATKLGIAYDMVRKIRAGLRGINNDIMVTIHAEKGFTNYASLKRLSGIK